MSIELLLVVVCGAGFGLGLVGVVALIRGHSIVPARRRPRPRSSPRRIRQVLIAAAVVVAVLVVTRWPVAAVAGGVIVVLWPKIFGASTAGQYALDKIEALASWTESLRDTASVGAGLEQAIPATVSSAPQLLQPALRALSARLDGRVPLPEALRHFADDLDDPIGDMVIGTLILNARQRSAGMVRILGSLTETARAELEMRRKVETERKGLRRQSRLIVIAVLGFVLLQAFFAHAYVTPFSTPVGQVVLAGVLAIFVGAFVRMRALAEANPPPRFLTSVDEVTEIASYPAVTS